MMFQTNLDFGLFGVCWTIYHKERRREKGVYRMGEIVSSVVYCWELSLSLILHTRRTHTHTSVGWLMVVLFRLYALGLHGDETQSCRAVMCDV